MASAAAAALRALPKTTSKKVHLEKWPALRIRGSANKTKTKDEQRRRSSLSRAGLSYRVAKKVPDQLLLVCEIGFEWYQIDPK